MNIRSSTQTYAGSALVPRKGATTETQETSASPEAGSQDKVEVCFEGHRPAHRSVKKIARGIAGAVALGAVGKAVYDVATAGSLAEGAAKVALDLVAGGVGVLAVDIGTGFAHHWGDNYGLPDPKPFAHTKWHADTDHSGYCLVGLSNEAMDKMQVWPKWEGLVHKMTGKTPLSWKVEPYRQYAAGEIDLPTAQARLESMGIHSDLK